MLAVVRDQIVEREPVVGGHEVDARPRSAPAVVVDVARSRQTGGEITQNARIALPEPSYRVAVAVVPFAPAGRKPSHLVAVGPDVPRFRDQFCPGEDRVLGKHLEKRGVPFHGTGDARQRGGEVEAKAVDFHDVGPVAQGVGDHPHYLGMVQIEGVSGSGEIHVVPGRIVDQVVVAAIIDASEREVRTHVVALSGVVVHHVQQDLDTGVVHHLHVTLEVLQKVSFEVRLVRGEKADRIVAPVVGETAVDQVPIPDKGVDRKQLHGGNAELPDILHDFRVSERLERTTIRLRNRGMAHRVPPRVHLVDDRLIPRAFRFRAAAPGEGVVNNLTLGHERGAIPGVERQISVGGPDLVGEERIVPVDRAAKRAGVRVHQQLVGIEAVPGIGIVRTVDTVAVQLSRSDIGKVRMPDLVGVLPQGQACDLAASALVEEAEFDRHGVCREEGEVGSTSIPHRPEGIGIAGPDPVLV